MKKIVIIVLAAFSTAFASSEQPYQGPLSSDTTTVKYPSGRIERTYTPQAPKGQKPVVVHTGRPDNGTDWGRHIEFRDKTREDHIGEAMDSASDEAKIIFWLISKAIEALTEALK